MGNAGPQCQQLSAAIATIAVDSHVVPSVFFERLAIAHSYDVDLLPIRLSDVYFIINAGRSVKVEDEILETSTLVRSRVNRLQKKEMVIWGCHRVDPLVIAHLQIAFDLFTGESHYIEVILIFIKLKHVPNRDRTLFDAVVQCQRCIE